MNCKRLRQIIANENETAVAEVVNQPSLLLGLIFKERDARARGRPLFDRAKLLECHSTPKMQKILWGVNIAELLSKYKILYICQQGCPGGGGGA